MLSIRTLVVNNAYFDLRINVSDIVTKVYMHKTENNHMHDIFLSS